MTSRKMNLSQQLKRADDSISHVSGSNDHTVHYITVPNMKNTTVYTCNANGQRLSSSTV